MYKKNPKNPKEKQKNKKQKTKKKNRLGWFFFKTRVFSNPA
jgi:hypothetical protein